ncbi:hypothetical protein Ancab_026787 [Ancistrocladus abbreviatus]
MSTPDLSGDDGSSGGGNPATPTRREVQLQGPRPTPLRVREESHKIRKPPYPPRHPSSQPSTSAPTDDRQPVIIYAVSPKVIQADASNFMSIVQRLTGFSSSSTSASTSEEVSSGPISPAVRLASIERTSPSERSKERERGSANVNGEVVDIVEGVDVRGQVPGILSPAPANLPGISAAIFSPVLDSRNAFEVPDIMSPFMYGSSFLPSPSGLLSVPVVSPTLSPGADLFFNNLFDFWG